MLPFHVGAPAPTSTVHHLSQPPSRWVRKLVRRAAQATVRGFLSGLRWASAFRAESTIVYNTVSFTVMIAVLATQGLLIANSVPVTNPTAAILLGVVSAAVLGLLQDRLTKRWARLLSEPMASLLAASAIFALGYVVEHTTATSPGIARPAIVSAAALVAHWWTTTRAARHRVAMASPDPGNWIRYFTSR